jgi:hypothetical protein
VLAIAHARRPDVGEASLRARDQQDLVEPERKRAEVESAGGGGEQAGGSPLEAPTPATCWRCAAGFRRAA